MKVSELIEALECYDDDLDVRLAMAPRWAMEYSINQVVIAESNEGLAIYLGEGRQIGYLPENAASQLGW